MATTPQVSKTETEMSMTELISCIFMVAMVLGVLWPAHSELARIQIEQSNAVTCWHNMQTLHDELDRYAKTHKGYYPKSLAELKMKDFPVCPSLPAKRENNYFAGYKVNNLGKSAGRYTIRCQGNNHADVGLPNNQPLYDSLYGMTPRVIEFKKQR